MMTSKFKYLLASARKALLGEGRNCPSCDHDNAMTVDRKYVVTSLCRCGRCGLLFRRPTSSAQEHEAFYQTEYAQGFTSQLPTDEALREYVNGEFSGTEKDYSIYIRVLEALGCRAGQRLLDFGCSWGYGSWQLRQHGFIVDSLEISAPRAAYARRKLGLNVFSSMAEVKGTYDVFFSSHVLEHVSSIGNVVEFGLQVLRPRGKFVAFTPNGSVPHRRRNPRNWHQLWGLVHPNFPDDVYYKKTFAEQRLLLASDPYDAVELERWQSNWKVQIGDLSGGELLVAAERESTRPEAGSM